MYTKTVFDNILKRQNKLRFRKNYWKALVYFRKI